MLFFKKALTVFIKESVNDKPTQKEGMSKKDLAIAVVEHFNQIKINEIAEAAINRDWEDFIGMIIGDVIKRAKGYLKMCLNDQKSRKKKQPQVQSSAPIYWQLCLICQLLTGFRT